MKLRLLFLLCVPLLFAGCESPAGVAHYRYGNLTDRIIQVEAPGRTDSYGNPHTFELAPGEEYELTYMHPRSVILSPFNYSEYVKISDGEREVTFVSRSDQEGQKTYLYDMDSYQVVKSKKCEIWFRYDFTEADFRDGVPVTEESDTDY